MKPSTRKKLLIGAGGVLGVLVVAALVAPSFFDLNTYKPMIAAEVKKATGRDLVLDGAITLSILPVPSVSVASVRFANVAGAKNAQMVEIKSVTVKPSLFALLTGEVAVSEVTLVEPKIVLEISTEGKPNWEFAPSVAEAKPAAPKPASAKPISLGRLNIQNGTLLFSDSKAGIALVVEKANVSASVGSPEGPFSLKGEAALNGEPLKIDLAVGAKASNGHTADIALQAGGGKVAFKGTLSELGANARVIGQASVSAESLANFISVMVGLSGQPVPPPSPVLAGKFSFEGAIDVSQTAASAKDFKVALGEDSGSGSVSVTLKPALIVDAKLAVPKLDMDKWLAAATKPLPSAAAKPPVAGTPAAPATAAPASAAASGLPANLTVKCAIDVNEVIYNKASIKNVGLELDIKGGAIAVPKLTATLPGDMVVQAKSTMSGDPARPQVAGEFSLVGPKLRDTLAWLQVDTAGVPPNKLAKVSLRGKMASSGGKIEVSGAVYELDDLKGTGGVSVTLGVPLVIVANVDIDTVDVDSYMPVPAAGQKPAAASSAAAPSAAAEGGPSIGLKARIAKVIYQKETIGGIDVDVALQGTTLKLNDVKVSNLAGARLALRGSVAHYASVPAPDIAFNFEAPDASRIAKLAGATAPAGLGQVSASGGIAGTVEHLTFRDLTVNGMGYSVRATGQLALPGAAKGAPTAAAYKGSLTINGQTVEGSVDAKLSGRPSITADLKAGAFDVDKITAAGGAAPARGQPAAAANKPIDTAPLRSLDASIKFAAATLVMSPTRITGADVVLTLKDGLLTLGHFKGGLYSGALALSGTVDGRNPALAFDFKGDANGILLGEMLRSTVGTNQFGPVKVTIDGKLNATGIAIKGSGTTSEQIKSSLAGGATLGGHVYAGADKALTMIGSAATGAVGGVIDNTLGTALGAVGQKGGFGVGNILNAISLVLNRFVNHDSPMSGRVEIAGGVLTDKGLAVQGSKATANIVTRTNIAASTTDTTINFVIGEDPSAPYLITTVRGPFSGLSYNAVRGSAKDPPGMIDTLTGGGGGSTGGQPAQQPSRSPLSIPNIPKIFGR